MYEIEFGSNFQKKYQKLAKNNKVLQTQVAKALKQLSKDPGYSSLKTHLIKHTKHGYVFSSFVNQDIRILWTQIDKKLILLLLDIGGHSGKNKIYK